MNKKFRLGHNYDITAQVKQLGWWDDSLAKYYICADVYDFHVYRIIVGFNSEYEAEPRTKLIEQGDISKYKVLDEVQENMNMIICYDDIREFPSILIDADFEDMGFKSIIKAVVDLDGGDNDDLKEYRYDTPIEELINDIDAGYGITVLDANLNEV